MKRGDFDAASAALLSRALVAWVCLLISFGTNADDCLTLYTRSGAVPGTRSCRLDVVGNTPGGMGNYACINDIALIDQWCSVPDADKPEKSCPVADPVYPGSGAVTLGAADFISGDDMPMRFTRTYRSKPLVKGVSAMGPAWFHSWQRQLGLANANSGTASSVLAYRQNGEPVTFNRAAGLWRTVDFTGLSLTQNSAGWTLADRTTDTVESYSERGVLLSETTKTGFTRTLTYDSSGLLTDITQHAAGTNANVDLTLRLTYDDRRRVTRLADPTAGFTYYAYDANDNLVSVTWPAGYVHRYVYEDTRFRNAVTGEIDEGGTRIATWRYDAEGRAIGVSHPDASRDVQFSYGSGSTAVTDSERTTTLRFASIGGMLRPIGSSSAAGVSSSTWDASGRLLKDSYVSGNGADYSYDDAGRPVRLIARGASGTTITSVRYVDTTSLHPSMIASPGKLTALVYDARGNATGISEVPTTDATGASGFDATRAAGHTRSYGRTYDPNNRLASVKRYDNDVLTLALRLENGASGNVESVTDVGTGEAHVAATRDAVHRVTRLEKPGSLLSLIYDRRGRIDLFRFTEYAGPLNGGVRRVLNVSYRYSPEGLVSSRSGTVATNGGEAAPVSSEEVDQWLTNLESGVEPAGPPVNRAGIVRLLLSAAQDAIEPVCIECILNPALNWGWAMSSDNDDPFGVVGMAATVRGVVGGIARLCQPTGAHTQGNITFQTSHYASRLKQDGVNVTNAESQVAEAVNSMMPNMLPNTYAAGRTTVDGVLVEFRVFVRPDGIPNVGTIFPVH